MRNDKDRGRKKKDSTLLNEMIRLPEVRCMDDDGNQYGIISSEEAQAKADELGMDLVLVVPNAKPPVCKIMDYGKYKYQIEKKKKEAKKIKKRLKLKRLNFL